MPEQFVPHRPQQQIGVALIPGAGDVLNIGVAKAGRDDAAGI